MEVFFLNRTEFAKRCAEVSAWFDNGGYFKTFPLVDVKLLLSIMEYVIKSEIDLDNPIKCFDFLTLKIDERNMGIRRNPQTGDLMDLGLKKIPKAAFTPSFRKLIEEID